MYVWNSLSLSYSTEARRKSGWRREWMGGRLEKAFHPGTGECVLALAAWGPCQSIQLGVSLEYTPVIPETEAVLVAAFQIFVVHPWLQAPSMNINARTCECTLTYAFFRLNWIIVALNMLNIPIDETKHKHPKKVDIHAQQNLLLITKSTISNTHWKQYDWSFETYLQFLWEMNPHKNLSRYHLEYYTVSSIFWA